MKREFVAIGLPDSMKAYLAKNFDRSLTGIRWTPQENLHLTMRFLGEVCEEAEGRLRAALEVIRVSPFTLKLGQVGMFPAKGVPKVIWIGVGTGHPLLFQLRQKIDDAVLGAGVDCEMRDFVPHITLGRCSNASLATIKRLALSASGEDGPVFSVGAFTLFESSPTPNGVRYKTVESFPLSRG